MKKKIISILVICIVCLILFYRPLFSGQPLGLDTLGHLSKISYIYQYPFASWDMSWYSGTLFLKLYSPLFYYISAVFFNPIFAANFLSFLCIFLTSLGIYLLVEYKTKDKKIALFCSLVYLTTLSLSYYWISVGNLPYFFALWTIPFSLYFLEKSIIEKKKSYFVFYSILFSAGILIHVVIGFLIGVLMILRFLFISFNLSSIKKIILYGAIPVLLSSFWFVPFLSYSNSSESYNGYAPNILFLFGLGKCCWGLQAGGIGILAFLFIPIVFVFFFKKLWKNKYLLFLLSALFILGFLLFGGLRSSYPFGVDPVRFILPFSIFLALFIGLTLNETKLFKKRLFFIIILIILIFGLVWNFNTINKNFNEYSYYKEGSRYKIIQDVINNSNFPIDNEFTNYRFGTSRYVFGETINYFMPAVSQTFGYQDAGMLNLKAHRDLIKTIWESEDINKSVYFFDCFGIKYFEGTDDDAIKKFKEDSRFKITSSFSLTGYTFTLFEYLEPKQIISLVDYVNETAFGKEKEFSWERKNPDKAIVKYNFLDENDVVLFKEFYHKTWKAKDINSGINLKIEKVGLGFMAVYPALDSKGIIFYQSKTTEDILGLILTLFGIILLIFIKKNN